MNERGLYPVLQHEQYPAVRQHFDFLFKALHASRCVAEGDLSEAGAVEIRCVSDPGLSQRGLGPATGFLLRGVEEEGLFEVVQTEHLLVERIQLDAALEVRQSER